MRWKGREQSENVEDRRGISPGTAVGGGGLVTLIVVVIAMFLGAPPEEAKKIIEQQRQRQGQNQQIDSSKVPGEDDIWGEFTRVILKDTEKVWAEQFRISDRYGDYKETRLVLFSDGVSTGCGTMSSKVGPFYCPADQTVYLDPNFFTELDRRHGAPGDFAQAYVIAHEVAHHVQQLTGYSQEVSRVRQRGNELESNRASVRLELQADYLAGVWAHHAQKKFDILQEGDIEEGIRAANAIGDDTLMRQATGRVMPDRYTHGTSEQRMRWFTEGLRTGDFDGCRSLFQIPYDQL